MVCSDSAVPVKVGKTGKGGEGHVLLAGVGLHDSSAALIPYLAQFKEPFLLLSTGTWCISLNPFSKSPLTAEELNNDCLCYLDYKGNPVKASRLFGGNEHEQQAKRLAEHYHVAPDYYKKVEYNPETVNQLTAASGHAPEKERHSGDGNGVYHSLFGRRDLSLFKTYDAAYHQLMLDLMADQ